MEETPGSIERGQILPAQIFFQAFLPQLFLTSKFVSFCRWSGAVNNSISVTCEVPQEFHMLSFEYYRRRIMSVSLAGSLESILPAKTVKEMRTHFAMATLVFSFPKHLWCVRISIYFAQSLHLPDSTCIRLSIYRFRALVVKEVHGESPLASFVSRWKSPSRSDSFSWNQFLSLSSFCIGYKNNGIFLNWIFVFAVFDFWVKFLREIT